MLVLHLTIHVIIVYVFYAPTDNWFFIFRPEHALVIHSTGLRQPSINVFPTDVWNYMLYYNIIVTQLFALIFNNYFIPYYGSRVSNPFLDRIWDTFRDIYIYKEIRLIQIRSLVMSTPFTGRVYIYRQLTSDVWKYVTCLYIKLNRVGLEREKRRMRAYFRGRAKTRFFFLLKLNSHRLKFRV